MGKTTKRVLIVDDEPIRFTVEMAFKDSSELPESPYTFEVDTASGPQEAIRKMRAVVYDVIVLDIRLQRLAEGLEIGRQLSKEHSESLPVRIMFSGVYNEIETCVEAMRDGAWDYIVKDAVAAGAIEPVDRIVQSAIERLQMFDLQEELKQRVMTEWLPRNLREIEGSYAGMVLALWHRPEVHVVATGRDAFELYDNLSEWRKTAQRWERPYLLRTMPSEAPVSREG